MLSDYSKECLAIPKEKPIDRLQCAFDAMPKYIRNSEAWSRYVWRTCGP